MCAMALSPGSSPSLEVLATLPAPIVQLAKTVVRFDALACNFASSFDAHKTAALRQTSERIKLLSESLRLALLMERTGEETAELGAELLAAMRLLQLLARGRRLDPSHQLLLRMGLALVEQIVKGLRDLSANAAPIHS